MIFLPREKNYQVSIGASDLPLLSLLKILRVAGAAGQDTRAG